MAGTLKQKRGTRAALDILAANSQIIPYQIYVISDEGRLAIGMTPTTYVAYVKSTEVPTADTAATANTLVQRDGNGDIFGRYLVASGQVSGNQVFARAVSSGHGYVNLTPGNADYTGYIEFYNGAGVRHGYIGFAPASGVLEVQGSYAFGTRPTFAGATPWDSSNLNIATYATNAALATKAPLASPAFTGGAKITSQRPNLVLDDSSYAVGNALGLYEIEVNGDFCIRRNVSTNRDFVGGVEDFTISTAGVAGFAVAPKVGAETILHTGNASVTSSVDTLVKRSASGDIYVGYTYTDAGLYSPTYASYFMPNGATGWAHRSGHATTSQLALQVTGGGTWGHLYANTSGEVGLLDGAGNWRLRSANGEIYQGSGNRLYRENGSINLTAGKTLQTPTSGQNAVSVKDLASYRYGASITGAMIFVAPVVTNYVMQTLTVKSFNYNDDRYMEFDVSSYTYTSNITYSQVCAHKGNFRPKVRQGYNAAGQYVLIIGDVDTVWSYPHVAVTEALLSHTIPAAYLEGWTSLVTTSLTGYSVGADLTPADKSNARTLDGLTQVTSATGSTIAARDSNGWLNASYFGCNTGLYHNTTGTLLSGSSSGWDSRSASASVSYLKLLNNADTPFGYFYGVSGSMGLLKSDSGWACRFTPSTASVYISGTERRMFHSGDNLVMDNGRKGLVGVYDAAQTQAVFAMGSAYTLLDGGGSANIGNLYGIAWSYNPDYGAVGNNPQSKAGLAHQALFMNAGVTQTAIGAGIWTIGAGTFGGKIEVGGSRIHIGANAPFVTGGNIWSAGYNLALGTTTANSLTFCTNGTTRIIIDTSGSISVPTNTWHTSSEGIQRVYYAASSHTYYKSAATHIFRNSVDATVATLDASGNLTVPGTMYMAGWSVSSDERIKSDLQLVSEVGKLIDALEVKSFLKEGVTGRQVGVIAQELQLVAPSLVHETAGVAKDGSPLLGVDANSLMFLMLAEMKDMRKRLAKVDGASQ